ncbi:MAG: hypothetical protein IKU11_07550, partial [Clostridia bacterium]|nr:hypothetical protein [Clostridia bacterium]
MEKAWNFIWNNFFCDKTEQFYDYLVFDSDDPLIGHLPTLHEIDMQMPNASGWGTGMEDAMLSAGSMLDGVVARYNVTGEEAMRALSSQIFRGMMRCIHLDNGYLARSVSPIDGKSFYYDTSRDQYTHWVYSALRFYSSPLSTELQKEDIRKGLTAIARRMEQNITPETGYNFLRYDGGESRVGQMWGKLGPHEYLRLPFFYLAAWHVTGDSHWFDRYMFYRDEGFERTLDFDIATYAGRCYPVLQMQYSLRGIYDLDPDTAFRNRIRNFMEKVANSVAELAPSEAKRLCASMDSPENYYVYRPWDQVRMLYLGIIGNRPYFNPAQSELPENRGFYNIRNVGEAVSILALCPGYKVSPEQFEALQNLTDAIDYSRHGSYAPMLLACGYWLAK